MNQEKWNKSKEEDFKNGCQTFFAALSKNYPKAQIFALTPIWRKNYRETRAFGDLRLHPNDSGFDHFFQNLHEQVTRSLFMKRTGGF